MPQPQSEPSPAHRNEVLLVGRVSARASRRELPSGDVVVGVRVVVERNPETLRGRTARVDAIDCVAWSDGCHEALASWALGDVVEVGGSLRRRFRRTDGGPPISRYEVEVEHARCLRQAESESGSDSSSDPVDPNGATQSQ